MRNWMSILLVTVSVLALLGVTAEAAEILPVPDGVFGLPNVSETSALAFWIPLEEGGVVSGVRWFNNDGNMVFPEVMAFAGAEDYPEPLDQAVAIATEVCGSNLGWSTVVFDQPLATTTDGIYVVFRLPTSGGFQHAGEGGGAGFGLVTGQAVNRCWVTTTGDRWSGFTAARQMAILPLIAPEKATGTMLVLSPGMETQELGPVGAQDGLKFDSQISAYPNPFNPQTTIAFELPHSGFVSGAVYDLRGRCVRNLWSGQAIQGRQEWIWNGRDNEGRTVPSGVYLVQVTQGSRQRSLQITMTK
jgi:hypothetical protein|nr:T9SS type A sorting domain-containing protein [Candidatus Krumholzibacteria bacterium]